MTTQNIDIDRLLTGMEILNREKAEIKVVLQFLVPYLERFCSDAIFRADDNKGPEFRMEVTSIFLEGEYLRLFAARKTFKEDHLSIGYELVHYDSKLKDHTLLLRDCILLDGVPGKPAKFFVEGLSGKSVPICRHHLLAALIAKIDDYPWFLAALEEFYAAADRSK